MRWNGLGSFTMYAIVLNCLPPIEFILRGVRGAVVIASRDGEDGAVATDVVVVPGGQTPPEPGRHSLRA